MNERYPLGNPFISFPAILGYASIALVVSFLIFGPWIFGGLK